MAGAAGAAWAGGATCATCAIPATLVLLLDLRECCLPASLIDRPQSRRANDRNTHRLPARPLACFAPSCLPVCSGINLSFFRRTDYSFQLVFYLLWSNCLIAFAFLLSSLFRSSKTGESA